MHIDNNTRQEIAKLIQAGYSKGFAHDADGQTVIWDLTIRLDR